MTIVFTPNIQMDRFKVILHKKTQFWESYPSKCDKVVSRVVFFILAVVGKPLASITTPLSPTKKQRGKKKTKHFPGSREGNAWSFFFPFVFLRGREEEWWTRYTTAKIKKSTRHILMDNFPKTVSFGEESLWNDPFGCWEWKQLSFNDTDCHNCWSAPNPRLGPTFAIVSQESLQVLTHKLSKCV